ncbi:MAG: EscU/YscU/HrcU family type III secretion system export apparatus switch protein [Deltaproteobacteria bacterium]|nr:EscU/YscU/HrcU family type III secretion system export apparatus switch protein [Deltaproteobacteria bacterium]MBW2019128.1 EscU/YscU/HrcU family type III secretion system export apparatus switch protein [Deltaproteobacteria bacterium]MBW2073195.1 EscU/YscU/HrcU family type III secretion system export apparatus switch protein [Deltaproteobacteria bacterium]RLB83815.1 MAG: flagellar biosynthesis protein FlhB [Deltaproteobacteria bacterium]
MPRKQKKAVGLKYRPGEDNAPKVTAKGTGKIAEKIIEIARKHGIPVKDDPDLVEVLSRLDLEEEIPPELYVIIAELLAFVYNLNRKKGSSRKIFP